MGNHGSWPRVSLCIYMRPVGWKSHCFWKALPGLTPDLDSHGYTSTCFLCSSLCEPLWPRALGICPSVTASTGHSQCGHAGSGRVSVESSKSAGGWQGTDDLAPWAGPMGWYGAWPSDRLRLSLTLSWHLAPLSLSLPSCEVGSMLGVHGSTAELHPPVTGATC